MSLRYRKCPACEGEDWEEMAVFDAPPKGEKDLGFAPYHRRLMRCGGCGLFVNRHNHDIEAAYGGAYGRAAYGGDAMNRRFAEIMALPPELSDNRQRAGRILKHAAGKASPLLDIGCGMGVFPAVMMENGIDVTAIDPDPASIAFMVGKSGAKGLTGDFMRMEIRSRFSSVTLNKVVEHVYDPVAMLKKAAGILLPGGFIYVEVPDGESAFKAEGAGRQEFYLEHYTAFSPDALDLVLRKSGLIPTRMERLREPSGKYTIFAFCGLPDE